MFAFLPGQFTRNNLFEDLFLFSRWEQEQNDPEGGSSQSFLLLSGIRTQERQPPGVLGLPGLWGPSCQWLLLMAVKQSLRPLSLARVSRWPCVSFSFFQLEMGVQRTVPREGLLPGEGVGTEWA